jgi:hypothetical protein
MKTKSIIALNAAVLAASLTCTPALRAAAVPMTPTLAQSEAGQNRFQEVAFRDQAEAQMLRDAYRILATGDHDYDGHRVRAMHAVEAAGKLLGMDLDGDLKDRTPQALSDDKMREAEGLINKVLGNAEVKDQKRIVKHLDEAVKQIHTALKIK